MPLTARDPRTGAIVRPEPGLDAVCRDPECGARLAYVRPQVDPDGRLAVVAHFRHLVAADRVCPHRTEDRDHKTPWHAGWQNVASDPDRVEHRHTVGDRTRVADIWTPYGWAVEVQHSGIAPATVRAREDHYAGRVVWLVDAASDTAPCHVDRWRDVWRVTPVPPWLAHTRTVVAFDVDEDTVVVAPPGRMLRAWVHGADLEMPARHCAVMDRARFAAVWVNGDQLPLAPGTRTVWAQERAQRAAQAAAARTPEREQALALARAQRAASDAGTCTYDGPRDRLLVGNPHRGADLPATPIPSPRPPADDTPAARLREITHLPDAPTDPHACHRAGCQAPASDPTGATPRDGWLGLLCAYHRGEAASARRLVLA